VEKQIIVAHIIGKWLGGGVESVVMNYYRHIDRSKIQFHFICDEDSTNIPYEEIEKLGGKVILIPPYQKILKYNKELKKVLIDGGYKIVHSHINTLSFFPLRIAKKCGVKVRIAHSHSTANKKEWKKTLIKNILKPFSKVYATDYFACSEYAGRWLFGNKTFNQGKVTVINNAIDLDKFKYDEKIRKKKRKELKISNDTLVIGHIGRFVKQKNHEFLIDIFNELHKENKDSKLLLIGQGQLKEYIEQKVKKLGLKDSVIFLGQREDVNELYNAMDVFLLPSLYEGLPVVGVEAQANGNLCFLSEAMTKETKVLDSTKFVSLNNTAKEWANIILKDVKYYKKHDTKEQVSKCGFDINEEVKKLEKRYIKISKPVVLHVVNSKVFSGLEKVACEIIEELSKKYDFIYVTQKGPIINTLKKKNIKYYIIDSMNVKEIKKVIKVLKPSIIHAHDYRASCICSLSTSNIPIISHLHANPNWIKKIDFLSLSYLFCAKKMKIILTVSNSIENEYVFSKYIKNKIKCISNPFSIEYVKKLVKLNAEKKYDICCIGRLDEPKDPYMFCDIIKEISQRNDNIKSVWIGDGPYREDIIKYCETLEIENNVDFCGFKENPYQLLSESKLFLLVTKWEGFGLSVLESLSLGVPAIVSNVGGLRGIVTAKCGKLCNNKIEFVDEVNLLLYNKDIYLKKSNNCLIQAKKYDNKKEYITSMDYIYFSLL